MSRRTKDPKDSLRKLVSQKVKPEDYWTYFFLGKYSLTAEERDAYKTIVAHMNPPPVSVDPLGQWGESKFFDSHPKLREAHGLVPQREWPKMEWEGSDEPKPAKASPDVMYAEHVVIPEDPPAEPYEPLPIVREPTEDDKFDIGKLLEKDFNSQGRPIIVRPMERLLPSTDDGSQTPIY